MSAQIGRQSIDVANALRRTEVFSGLRDEVLNKIAAHSVVQRLDRGEMLYSEHDTATGFFVVAEGELRAIRQSADGREQVLSIAPVGTTLGEAPLFRGGKYFSTVIAGVPAAVVCIERTDMHRICREHSELLWNFARSLSAQVLHCAELIESLAFRNVDQRVAQHLLMAATDRAVRCENGHVFELTLTRPEIARRVGSVREVISRSLAHLHERGLIVLGGNRLVTVPNLEALREFAEAAVPPGPAPSLKFS